jgi:nondiscriminating aspartyl-tRNA synthetase
MITTMFKKFNCLFKIANYKYILGKNTNYIFYLNKKYSDTMEPVNTKFSFVKDESDVLKDRYGVLPFIQSKSNPEERYHQKFFSIQSLSPSDADRVVKIRARLQRSRIKGKGGFIVLRESFHTLQGCIFVTEGAVSKQMLKFIEALPLESIVDVEGKIKLAQTPIESCSQQQIELEISTIYLVVDAVTVLPFQFEDANRKVNPELEDEEHIQHNTTEIPSSLPSTSTSAEATITQNLPLSEKEKKQLAKKALKEQKEKDKKEKSEKTEKKEIIVGIKTRLDHRVLDLRVPATQSIMRLQSGVGMLFREYLYNKGFIEIHTPKLISGASEGGANVFKMKYFDQNACLAQSPQLYKQMAVIGDLDRVFEIGPVFRAENANTPRHLCEFTGLDIEMSIKEHYFEVLDVIGELFYYIFEGLNQRFATELKAFENQYPFEPLKFSKDVLKLDFREGVELLKSKGRIQDVNEDLDTENERELGKIVREKYDTDFYILYRYPKSARPFYTMPDPDDDNFTNSYDAFIRGEEVLSGAQRVHTYDLLLNKVLEKGINPETLKDYINAFKLGAPPHGGCGIGLERVVKLFVGLNNIKKCVMFPRDPKRLTP